MFDTGLGRFVGRDPWKKRPDFNFAAYHLVVKQTGGLNAPKALDGYQDGMSLYNGYFVPNSLDPSGMGDAFYRHGTCCNRSGSDEWALVSKNGVAGAFWVKLPHMHCIGSWLNCYDCEGMTCDGGFYKAGFFLTAVCMLHSKEDAPPYKVGRWTPNAPEKYAQSPTQRGSTSGDVPPGYGYGNRGANGTPSGMGVH
jgi:hypothetical protein